MTRRTDVTPDRPLTVAHKAGNSLELLRRAEAAGVDLVEADVRLFRGRIEVRHLKTMGPVPLLWDRWLIAPGWGPRFLLEDLLQACGAETELLLDIKRGQATFPHRILEVMRDSLRGREYSVCSQFWHLLEPFQQEPAVRVFHSVGNSRQLSELLSRRERWRPQAISIHQKLLTPSVVKRLLAMVPVITSWPVNTAQSLSKLQGWGVNGFTSDDLDLLAALSARRGQGGGVGLVQGSGDAGQR